MPVNIFSPLAPPAFGNHHCNVFQLQFLVLFCFFHIWGILYNIWCISLGIISSRSICIVKMAGFPFFSRLSRSPLSMYVCFYSFIRWRAFWLLPHLGYLWTIIAWKCSYLFNDLFLFLLELEDDIDWDYNLSAPCPSPATALVISLDLGLSICVCKIETLVT